jgi:hypothetical protein
MRGWRELRAMVITLAIFESMRTGQEVILESDRRTVGTTTTRNLSERQKAYASACPASE